MLVHIAGCVCVLVRCPSFADDGARGPASGSAVTDQGSLVADPKCGNESVDYTTSTLALAAMNVLQTASIVRMVQLLRLMCPTSARRAPTNERPAGAPRRAAGPREYECARAMCISVKQQGS